MDGARAEQAVFVEADLRGASMRKAWLKRALFVDARMPLVDLTDVGAEEAIFHRASCREASFRGANLTYADFSHADVSGADFTGASVYRSRFHRVQDEDTLWCSRAAALGEEADVAESEDWNPPY